MECDELKSVTAYQLTTNTEDSDVYIHNDEFGCGGDAVQVYIKSEADKYIESIRNDYKDPCGKLNTVGLVKDELYHRLQHANYKRCVAMSAYWDAVRYKCIDEKHRRQADKNNKRWLELSKRYKEAKE